MRLDRAPGLADGSETPAERRIVKAFFLIFVEAPAGWFGVSFLTEAVSQG
jgi:hypothetical protein